MRIKDVIDLEQNKAFLTISITKQLPPIKPNLLTKKFVSGNLKMTIKNESDTKICSALGVIGKIPATNFLQI